MEDNRILINKDPLDKPDFSDSTKTIAHPKMPRLGILNSDWYPLITDDMLRSIEYQFAASYEADKQNLLHGSTLFPTKEILDKAYRDAPIVLYGIDDDYAKCAIIINILEDPECNNGSAGMRRFLVPRN